PRAVGVSLRTSDRAALAAQLTYRFDQKEQPVHARVTIRQSATIGVDCEAAVGTDAPAADENTALAFLAKAEVLQEQDGVDGEGVIELDGVDVGRAELGHRESGLPSGQRAG